MTTRKSVFTIGRGKKLYFRLKDEHGRWKNEPTPFERGQESDAERFAIAAQRTIDRKRGELAADAMPTVSEYAATWLDARSKRGLVSFPDDKGRINNHVLPKLGTLRMDEVTPIVIRDFVRELRANPNLAPRTILHVVDITRAMFHSAMIEQLVVMNPVILERGEKPAKVDKDPEWRAEATYTTDEVRTLVTDRRIPPTRRVQYALKALAALRHGEMAGLAWRHYDDTLEPLGRLLVTQSYDRGKTKTEVTRRVPVHPALAAILAAWRAMWADVYGDEPTPDDLIVPTRNRTMVDPSDASEAFKADLVELGLRVKAGKHRSRGGHDFRAWFLTSAREDGADPVFLEEITHAKKRDVIGGYSRFKWSAICSAMSALRFELVDRDPLAVCLDFAYTDSSYRNRYLNTRPRRDSNPDSRVVPSCATEVSVQNDQVIVTRGEIDELRGQASLLRQLAAAVMAGDELAARRLAAEVEGRAVEKPRRKAVP